MNLEVLHPGFNTTIQDSGRINGLAYGVPRGGAMDLNLMYLANKLVGNSRTNPVLEFTMKGGKYRFDDDSIIACTGFKLISKSINTHSGEQQERFDEERNGYRYDEEDDDDGNDYYNDARPMSSQYEYKPDLYAY